MDPVQQPFYSRLPPLHSQKQQNSEPSVMLVTSQYSYPGPRVHGAPAEEQFSTADAGYAQEQETHEKNIPQFLKYQYAQTSQMQNFSRSNHVNLSHSSNDPQVYLHQLFTQQNFPNHSFLNNSSQNQHSPGTLKILSTGNSPASVSLHPPHPSFLINGASSSSSQPSLRLQNSTYVSEGAIYPTSGHAVKSLTRPSEIHNIQPSSGGPQASPQARHMRTLQANDVQQPMYHSMNQHSQNLHSMAPTRGSLSINDSRDSDLLSSHTSKIGPILPIQGIPRAQSQLYLLQSEIRDNFPNKNDSHIRSDGYLPGIRHAPPEQRSNLEYKNLHPSKDLDFVFVNDQNAGSSGLVDNGHSSLDPSRKRQKHSLADEMERHFKSLVTLAAGCTFDDLGLRIKRMDSSDPIFGSLCNSKDMRLDRHHQLFGLAWLAKQCEVSYTTVVTRTRVYARYVDTCAQQKISPLMPTNFGKLVRVTFPNITVRRLGMRGKSKYYYCGIKLIGEPEKSTPPLSPQSARGAESPQSVNAQSPNGSDMGQLRSLTCTAVEFTRLNEHFKKIDLKYVPNLFSMIESSVNAGIMEQGLDFPSIYSYIPDNFDVDYTAADNLQNSYKAHLIMIFELFRFMQSEKLFETTSSLLANVGSNSTLLANEALAGWVRDCDLVMYRCAAKMLARLHLHNVPTAVVEPLKRLSKDYYSKVYEALKKQFPLHFVKLKLNLAKQFMDLVSRLLFCIEFGAQFSAILSNPSEKVVMLEDWLSLDIPDIVLRELPCGTANIELLIEILDTRLVKLLEEPNSPRRPVMAKYSEFLFELPEKFPNTSPWLFLVLASNILTTCIREMTLAGSRSFKSWWILRCWVDEFIKWYLELGGYLYDDYKPQIQPFIKLEAYEGPLGLNHSFPHDLSNQESTNYVDLLELMDNSGFNWI